MADPFRIGIAGLGTVGTGVIKILTQNAELVSQRAGVDIEIAAVSARNKNQDRGAVSYTHLTLPTIYSV